MMEGVGLCVLGILGLLWICDRMRVAHGKITVSPGEGVIAVYTGFRPRNVRARISEKHPVPGCSQIEDSVEVVELTSTGFVLKYKVESGIGTIRWRARR